MQITQSEYMQLLDKIDEEVTMTYDPIIEPVGNDDGRIAKAIKALLTCNAKDLASNQIELQLAYCAYFKIDEDQADFRTLGMSRDQRAANDAGVDGRYFS